MEEVSIKAKKHEFRSQSIEIFIKSENMNLVFLCQIEYFVNGAKALLVPI